MKSRTFALVFILAAGAALFAGYSAMGPAGAAPIRDAVMERGIAETGAQNLVAAIYLDYRLFDTLLEALLLLVAVTGVSQFSRLSGSECVYPDANRIPGAAHPPSHVMAGSLGAVYFFIALFGVYVILTGMDGPGGGFQGGAILAAIAISAHFAEGRLFFQIPFAEKLEKVMYILIVASGAAFLAGYGYLSIEQRRAYLILMNVLIGIKVFSGLFMIYLRFMSSGTETDAPEEEKGGD